MCVKDYYDPSVNEAEEQQALDAFFMECFGMSDFMYCAEDSVR